MTRPEEIAAAHNIDWQQVVLNGGPPCFHVEDGTFCLRAQRWAGHDGTHRFFSFADLLRAANPPINSESSPAPATPAVGEDEALLEKAIASWKREEDAWIERERALLADVARLTEERDGLRLDLGLSDVSLRHEREWRASAEKALEQRNATLAAVRKVAENYHDVDHVGDPPHEVACNPCAAEILNVLEGNHEPRR